MPEQPPFRFLSDQEFNKLSHEQKLSYLKQALEARRRAEKSGPANVGARSDRKQD